MLLLYYYYYDGDGAKCRVILVANFERIYTITLLYNVSILCTVLVKSFLNVFVFENALFYTGFLPELYLLYHVCS